MRRRGRRKCARWLATTGHAVVYVDESEVGPPAFPPSITDVGREPRREGPRHDHLLLNVEDHFALGFINMRKGIDGLAMLVPGIAAGRIRSRDTCSCSAATPEPIDRPMPSSRYR